MNTQIEITKWQDVRRQVYSHNPHLCQLIDEIDPTGALDAFPIAHYSFGEMLIQRGKSYIHPDVSASSSAERVPEAYRSLLGYAHVPLSLLLNKACEIFIEIGRNVVPQTVLMPGSIFGAYESLVQKGAQVYPQAWCLSAGVRTLFFLPSINDNNNHKRLAKHYRLSEQSPPKSLFEHWHLFKSILRSHEEARSWHCDVLLFPKLWYDHILNSNAPAWLKLKNYLLKQAFHGLQSLYCRSGLIDLHNRITHIVSEKRFNTSHYCIDTIKHIMAIQSGNVPGFQFADDQEIKAPTKAIQVAYLEHYHLKNYLPVIMVPGAWQAEQIKNPVYYSLNLPTLVDCRVPNQANIRKTDLLYKIKVVLDALNNKDFVYQYIHNQNTAYNDILPADQVIENDENIQALKRQYPGKVFPNTSPYMKGCIQINLKSGQAYQEKKEALDSIVEVE